MAQTDFKDARIDWLAVAGTGDVVFTAQSRDEGRWVISTDKPAFSGGHKAPMNENISLRLETGETLWVLGDIFAVTATGAL